MVAGVNALREIDVYPRGNMSMSLGEYLLMRGELHEFLMANFLHDIGHSPLSHVLEPNPFIELDHEEITRNLILGKAVKGDGEGEMDWYVAERYLLKMKAIKDFEHRFLENRYDSIYDVGEEKWEDEEGRKANFLKCVKENGEILESEVVTVKEVLENFGVDAERVVEILSGKIFCPCGKLLKIEDGKVETCEDCGAVKRESEKIYDTQFLNKLIESEIDIDRMDHVKRDSVVCGLSLSSFRLLELLGSMSVVLPDSDACTEIYNQEGNGPYILISENGLLYVMDLLNARKSVFNDVLYSDANNWINGVVNQITALAVRSLPHITNMLPFITDQILMHFYTNELFLGTQIEKLNRLFHGKMDSSGYGKPMRYKLKDGVIVTEKKLKKIYKKIEKINDDHEYKYKYLELPAVVFYTNIKFVSKECDDKGCGGKLEDLGDGGYKCNLCGSDMNQKAEDWKKDQTDKDEKKRSWDDILVYGRKAVIKKGGEKKFLKFIDLVKNGKDQFKYEDTSREVFPTKPNELDVKNLLYVWVSDFVVRDENSDINNGAKSKNEWRNDIKEKIGGVWLGENKIDEFEKRFVDLDDIAEVKRHE
jgi:HD superfamily phosphohydrolase